MATRHGKHSFDSTSGKEILLALSNTHTNAFIHLFLFPLKYVYRHHWNHQQRPAATTSQTTMTVALLLGIIRKLYCTTQN